MAFLASCADALLTGHAIFNAHKNLLKDEDCVTSLTKSICLGGYAHSYSMTCHIYPPDFY